MATLSEIPVSPLGPDEELQTPEEAADEEPPAEPDQPDEPDEEADDEPEGPVASTTPPKGHSLAYVCEGDRYRTLLHEALEPLGYDELPYFASVEAAVAGLRRAPGAYRTVLLHEPLADPRSADQIVVTLRQDAAVSIVVMGDNERWTTASWPDLDVLEPPVTAAAIVKAVARRKETEYSDLVQRLIKTPGFRSFSADALSYLLSKTRAVQVQDGRVLFEPGSSGRTMYFVLAGQIGLYVGDREVERVVSGGIFGELAMLEARPRTARAVTLGTTVLLEVTVEMLEQADAEFRSILFELLTRTLARRLRRTTSLMETLGG